MIGGFLRTAPSRRLLAVLSGVVLVVVLGAAIAIAATGGGPVPPRKSLPSAIRQALGAPKITGITARISYSNHLIGASNFQGSDPLISGASGRLWLSPDQHRLRLELQGDNGDAQLVVNGRSAWVYDPSAHTVYEGTLPASVGSGAEKPSRHDEASTHGLPSVVQIQKALNHLARHLTLSGALAGDIGGRPAYTVRVSPKLSGGLLGAAELGWDAIKGIPLRVAVYARGQSAPVLELKATDVSYGAVPASTFAISPPQDAKVVKVSPPASGSERRSSERRRHTHRAPVSGVRAVARRLSFHLDAPAALAGRARSAVRLIDWKGTPATLLVYGHGLGSVVVLEQRASAHPARAASTSSGGDQQGFTLPTVSINGTSGQELDTALGTIVRFTRAGIAYTVLGSVSSATADQAARGL